MHQLQPKHIKLEPGEVDKLFAKYNISLSQLPKIKLTDPALPEGCEVSDVVKIERIINGKKSEYYRVVVI